MEPLIFLLVGIFWILSRYNVAGGVFLLITAVVDFAYPASPWVALPLLGVILALLAPIKADIDLRR